MYKIEIFDEALGFQAAAAINEDQEIEEDYLAPQPYSIVVAGIPAPRKGWYTHITESSRVVADGMIQDVQADKHTVTLSIAPLLILMDCQTFRPASIPDVDAWLAAELKKAYVTTPDIQQRRPILVDPIRTHPARPAQLPATESVVTLLEIATQALTTYGVTCVWRLDFAARGIRVQISRPTAAMTLEADLDNVLTRSITLGDSYGGTSKLTVRHVRTTPETGTVDILGQVVYYLHPDGSVDTSDTERIAPVFWGLTDLEDSETWAEDARRTAQEALLPEQFDQEIELTYSNADALIQPLTCTVGTGATIYLQGRTYRSLLTGRRMTAHTTTLIFGTVRQDLTKRLQRRF